MSRSRSHSFTVTFRVVVVLPDVVDMPGSALSEQNLADPDKSVDAAMDDLLPRDASPEILRQAQRCLLACISVGLWTTRRPDIPRGPRTSCNAP
jgi:hypothetical protein